MDNILNHPEAFPVREATNMHMRDRNAHLDQPGGANEEIFLAWYDFRDAKLVAAFARLKASFKAEHIIRTYFWRIRYAVLPLLMIGWGITMFLPDPQRLLPLLVCGALIALYRTCVMLAVWWVKARRNKLAEEIRRGTYGKANMWDIDPAWTELDAALQRFQLSMQSIVTNQVINTLVTPVIAEYLEKTFMERGMLRIRTTVPHNDHPSLQTIRQEAANTANMIHRALAQ